MFVSNTVHRKLLDICFSDYQTEICLMLISRIILVTRCNLPLSACAILEQLVSSYQTNASCLELRDSCSYRGHIYTHSKGKNSTRKTWVLWESLCSVSGCSRASIALLTWTARHISHFDRICKQTNRTDTCQCVWTVNIVVLVRTPKSCQMNTKLLCCRMTVDQLRLINCVMNLHRVSANKLSYACVCLSVCPHLCSCVYVCGAVLCICIGCCLPSQWNHVICWRSLWPTNFSYFSQSSILPMK